MSGPTSAIDGHLGSHQRLNRQHVLYLSCCHGEPQCCASCEEACAEDFAEKVRNPEYPHGMTLDELIANSETLFCIFCGRRPQDDTAWTDADHDGFCAIPFMRAALMKIALLKHEKWEITHKAGKATERIWTIYNPTPLRGNNGIIAVHVDGEKRLTVREIEQWLANLEQARYQIAALETAMLEAGLEIEHPWEK